MIEEPIVLGLQRMKKLQNVPSPAEPYLSQAQAAVAAARKALGMSPHEVLLCFLFCKQSHNSDPFTLQCQVKALRQLCHYLIGFFEGYNS